MPKKSAVVTAAGSLNDEGLVDKGTHVEWWRHIDIVSHDVSLWRLMHNAGLKSKLPYFETMCTEVWEHWSKPNVRDFASRHGLTPTEAQAVIMCLRLVTYLAQPTRSYFIFRCVRRCLHSARSFVHVRACS